MSLGTWMMARYYDRVMHDAEARCLSAWRAELLASANGRVLEIGGGTGVNLAHYPQTVDRLIVTEPDPHMRKQLLRHIASGNKEKAPSEVLDCPAEDLAAASHSLDVVVSTLVLCTVRDPDRVLAEVRRVLKPGGRLLFLEHVAAEDNPSRHVWQRRIEPVWKRVAGGCCLTRRTEEAIHRAGFVIDTVTRQSMRGAPPWVRPTIRGSATSPAT